MFFKRKPPEESLRIESEAAEGRFKKIAANHARNLRCSPLCAAQCEIKAAEYVRWKKARLAYIEFLLKLRELKK